MWDELRKEFQGMDPYNTGCVSREEFREVLIELCVNLSDTELESLICKFDTRKDDRSVSQIFHQNIFSCEINFMYCPGRTLLL